MNGKNDISVVIPVLNGADQLRKLVQSIRDQQHCVIREIIVIDSASDDETFEISRELHLTFLPLQHRYQFDHGGTRTNAARTAQGEFVFFLTQDVELNDKMAVSKLLAPMLKIPEIAACYGRQIPYPDTDFFARSIRAFNYPSVEKMDPCEKSPREERWNIRCAFLSNNFCLYRRSVMESLGWFGEEIISSEDFYAGAKLRQHGYQIAYVADAVVVHSHNFNCIDYFRRYFDIGVFHKAQSWIHTLFGPVKWEGFRFLYHEWRMIFREHRYFLLPVSVFYNVMKWLGFQLGRRYTWLPMKMRKFFSANLNWWQIDRQGN